MTRPNISPGEWKIDQLSPSHIEASTSDRSKQVVYVHYTEEKAANIRAITALPKLLTALESALSLLEAANDHQRAAGRLEYDTNTVRAALLAAGYTE
jgi:homoserine trans-succinylase